MEREVRLLRVVAVMVVMRAALNSWELHSTVSIILRVWASPHLALLGPSGSFILVGKVMCLVSPLGWPLLLLVGMRPCTLIREVAVVSLSTQVVMRMMAASLRPNWRWRLIGCPTVRSRLLYGSQHAFSYAMWRCITPEMRGGSIIIKYKYNYATGIYQHLMTS